jgi:hypothetical protein
MFLALPWQYFGHKSSAKWGQRRSNGGRHGLRLSARETWVCAPKLCTQMVMQGTEQHLGGCPAASGRPKQTCEFLSPFLAHGFHWGSTNVAPSHIRQNAPRSRIMSRITLESGIRPRCCQCRGAARLEPGGRSQFEHMEGTGPGPSVHGACSWCSWFMSSTTVCSWCATCGPLQPARGVGVATQHVLHAVHGVPSRG